jgi:hypothetical protein
MKLLITNSIYAVSLKIGVSLHGDMLRHVLCYLQAVFNVLVTYSVRRFILGCINMLKLFQHNYNIQSLCI